MKRRKRRKEEKKRKEKKGTKKSTHKEKEKKKRKEMESQRIDRTVGYCLTVHEYVRVLWVTSRKGRGEEFDCSGKRVRSIRGKFSLQEALSFRSIGSVDAVCSRGETERRKKWKLPHIHLLEFSKYAAQCQGQSGISITRLLKRNRNQET